MLVVVHQNAVDEGRNTGGNRGDVPVDLGIVGGDVMTRVEVALQRPAAQRDREDPQDQQGKPSFPRATDGRSWLGGFQLVLSGHRLLSSRSEASGADR